MGERGKGEIVKDLFFQQEKKAREREKEAKLK